MNACDDGWNVFARDLAAAYGVVVWRCRRVGPDGDDAAQEAALAAVEAFRAGEAPPRSLVAWMTTVAHRRRVDGVRSQTRTATALARFHARLATEQWVSDFTEDVAGRDEARCRVARLAELPVSTRRAVAAVARGGSLQEAADDLHVSYRSVEGHLRRARAHLRG